MTTPDRFTASAAEREAAQDAALPAFRRWSPFLHLHRYGHGVPSFDKYVRALRDVRAWRHASNTRGEDYEPEVLAVRVVADALAEQVLAAATDQQDPATVAWLAAGLRCPLQPFCTGCPACQTVTAPGRPCNELRGVW